MLALATSPNILNVLVLLALSIPVRPMNQESTPGPDAIAAHTWSGVASTVISSRTCSRLAAKELAGHLADSGSRVLIYGPAHAEPVTGPGCELISLAGCERLQPAGPGPELVLSRCPRRMPLPTVGALIPGCLSPSSVLLHQSVGS